MGPIYIPPLKCFISFSIKYWAGRSLAPEFQDKDGSLRAVRRFSPGSDDESALVELAIPTTALGTPERKLKARGCLVKEAQVLQCSKDFDVSFPKN